MDYTISFRDFEERDIDFVYKCKNNEKLNSMIVGSWHPYTYEEAVKWVHGCMGEHDTFKFWAICTKDEIQRIVGWVSLSSIDRENKSVCHYGLVLADNEYNDGSAMFESMYFTMSYAFDELRMHRLYGCCFSDHKISPYFLSALGFVKEGVQRDAVLRNGRFSDVSDYAILRPEFENNRNSGLYEIDELTSRFVLGVKKQRRK